MSNRRQGVRGQALLEGVFIIPVLLVVVVMIFWFCQVLLTKQQLVMAARYGTDLITTTNMSEQQVREEIRDYLCGKGLRWRRLDPGKLSDDNIQLRISREPKVTVATTFTEFYFPGSLNNTSWVEIQYSFGVPRMLNTFARFFGSAENKKGTIGLSARSEVMVGTGCRGCK